MRKSRLPAWTYRIVIMMAVLVLAGAGCSGSTPSTTAVIDTDVTDKDVTDTDENVYEEAIVTFGAYEYQRQAIEPLMETFHEQNPDITVQFVELSQAFPQDEEWSENTYLRNLAQAADTVMTQGLFETDMSRYFRDLRPLYESDPSFQPDDFWPGILSACEDSYGNMVGLPMSTSVNGIFYNKAAFDAAGMPYPELGWTWEDFQEAINVLTEKVNGQTRYGFYDQPGLYGSILVPWVTEHLQSHGGEVDAAELQEKIQWYIDLVQADRISGIKTEAAMETEWEDRMRLFEDEALRPAMWIDSLVSSIPSNEGNYDPENPNSGMSINLFGFTAFPVFEGQASIPGSAGWAECASVSAGSSNPRAAWKWVNFLSNHWLVVDETQVYEMARIPARQSVADSSGYWNLLPEQAITTVRYILEHTSYGFTYSNPIGALNTALAKTIYEDADFVQAFETAMAEMPIPVIPTPDEAPIVVATPRAPLPEGVTAIKYYFIQFNPNELNAMKTLVEQYNQNSSDSRIEVLTEFYGNPGEDWVASIASNFDCFTSSAPYGPDFNPEPLLKLNSFLSGEPASFASDFSDEMLAKFSVDGNLYALPASSQVQMIAYNADLLARRGLEIPDNDWTFNDFMELAIAASSTDDADPSYGYMFSPYDEFITRGKDVEWADLISNPPEVYLDSPDMREHLEWLAEMESENVLLDQESDWEKTQNIMISGQLAFWSAMMGDEASWFYGMGQDPTFKIGMAPYPEADGSLPTVTWSNDRGHFISAQAEDPRACWEFIKFLSDQPTLFTGIPARRSVAESSAWEAVVGRENAAAYRAALAKVKPVEDIEFEMQQIVWPLSNWRSLAVKAALEGQDIEPILVSQQQKAEDYLACALVLDTSMPFEELNEAILSCLRQADPEGGW